MLCDSGATVAYDASSNCTEGYGSRCMAESIGLSQLNFHHIAFNLYWRVSLTLTILIASCLRFSSRLAAGGNSACSALPAVFLAAWSMDKWMSPSFSIR